jgi:hypothetical protein
MNDRRSISERLRAVGLGHKADARGRTVDGRRVVFAMATGRELGRFDALEAVELLRVLEGLSCVAM